MHLYLLIIGFLVGISLYKPALWLITRFIFRRIPLDRRKMITEKEIVILLEQYNLEPYDGAMLLLKTAGDIARLCGLGDVKIIEVKQDVKDVKEQAKA